MAAVTDIPLRYRSPTLLLVGSLFGLAGFLAAFSIGAWDYFHLRTNFLDEDYKSGHGYWPSSVSEMVNDWNSPQGRIFFGCCFITAFLYLLSWYPFALRNVYAGPEKMTCCCGCCVCYWNTFRQISPVVGLLLVICVSSVPRAVAVGSDRVSTLVHLVGTGMMFLGYSWCEFQVLHLCSFFTKTRYLDIETQEKVIRVALVVIMIFSYVSFCLLQGALLILSNGLICCPDVYVNPNLHITNQKGAELQGNKDSSDVPHVTLLNTASGLFLFLKFLSFMAEVTAGLSMLTSHMAIWYYCEERNVAYGEEHLTEVYDEERQVSIKKGYRRVELQEEQS